MTKYDDAVYQELAARVDADGLASPPLALIAAALSINIQTVRRAVKSLITEGRLEVVSQHPGQPTYYALCDPVENPGLALVPPLSEPLSEPLSKLIDPPYQNPGQEPTQAQSKKPPTGVSTLGGLGGSKNPDPNPYQKCDCRVCVPDCGRPKLADETHCPWCGHIYDHLTPSPPPEWSTEPREIPEPIAQTIGYTRTKLQHTARTNRRKRYPQ